MRAWFRPVFALALLCGPASAQVNYNPYPIGERAAGMGGAYVGLANDEAGAWYNPAGPAFTTGDSLAVSTAFYGVVLGRNRSWLGANEDFRYSTLNLIPTTSSTLWHFGEATAERPAPLALLFNVFSPGSFNVDQRRDVRAGETTLFLTVSDRTLVAGPSAAYRLSKRFGVGAGLWVSFHSYTERFDLTDRLTTGEPPVTQFLQLTLSEEQTNFGLVGIAGARWSFDERWSVGLSARTATLHLAGTGTTFVRRVSTPTPDDPGLQTVTNNVQTQRLMPARLSLGVGYERTGQWAFSADVHAHLPLSYLTLRSAADPTLDEGVDYGWVVNGAVGFETYVHPIVPLRFGVFTDFSPAPFPTLEPGGSSEDRLDSVGATFSCGISTQSASTTFGLVATYGWANLIGIDLSQATYQLFPTTGTQWRLYFVWSSSYRY